jgi:hypothetical protein
MIKLIEESHTYVNDQFPDCKYTSVTTVIGQYEEKFDEDFHAERVAARKGLLKEDVIKEWREINRQANEYGTKIHAILERFLLAPNRLYIPRDEFEDIIIKSFYSLCVENELNLLSSNTIKPEHIMSIEFNPQRGLAGTADVIEDLPDNRFNIWDFKTNKKFNFESKYNKYLKFPLAHLPECQFVVYTIQLSIYCLMYERETGRKFNRGGLLYWDRHSNLFSLIPIIYMKMEAQMLLDHFSLSLNK